MQQHQANSWQRSFNLLPVRSARWKIPEVRTAGLAWTSTSERWGLTLPTGAFPGVLPLFTFASSRRPTHWMCPILRSKTPVYSIFGTKQDRSVFDGLLPWKPVLPRLWCSEDAFSSSPQAVGTVTPVWWSKSLVFGWRQLKGIQTWVGPVKVLACFVGRDGRSLRFNVGSSSIDLRRCLSARAESVSWLQPVKRVDCARHIAVQRRTVVP